MIYYDTETKLTFSIAAGKDADIAAVSSICKKAAHYVVQLIEQEVGIPALVTNAKRTVASQVKAMDDLKEKFGNAYYLKVYGTMVANGIKPENMPHPSGRAIDFRYAGYEKATERLQELNALYLEGIRDVIGYVPARLVVVEKNNCYHIQTPPIVHDEQAYQDYIINCVDKV
jgi:hypothetical protein